MDVLQTRSGMHPTYLLLVGKELGQDWEIIKRRDIRGWAWERKLPFSSPLGQGYEIYFRGVFENIMIPVERGMDSVARALMCPVFRNNYTVYADLIQYHLRRPTVETPDGWYDLLSEIAHVYAIETRRITISNFYLHTVDYGLGYVQDAVDDVHRWYNNHCVGGLKRAALRRETDHNGRSYFYLAFRITLRIVERTIIFNERYDNAPRYF